MVRRIDGKEFAKKSEHNFKKDANIMAKKLRNNGYYARRIKGEIRWEVWKSINKKK